MLTRFSAALREDPGMRVGVALIVIMALIFSVVPLVQALLYPDRIKDYSIWYETGRRVLDGLPLYPRDARTPFPFMYPPTIAVLVFAPLSLLGLAGLTAAMVIANSIAWIVASCASVYLASGRLRGNSVLTWFVPVAATAPYVWDTYLLGQTNLILLALVLLGFIAMKSGRRGLAGSVFGAAASLKAFPLLLLGYLAYRRDLRGIVAMVGALAVLLVVVPAPVRGLTFNLHELGVWASGMVFKMPDRGIAQRPDVGLKYGNQSLLAVTHRLTRSVVAGHDDRTPFAVNVMNLDASVASLLAVAIIVGLCLFGALMKPPGFRPWSLADPPRWELGMTVILVVVCSPLAWTYFYCWLMLPVALLTCVVQEGALPTTRRRAILVIAGLSALCLASALLQNVDQHTQAWGVTLWGALGLYAALGVAARSDRSLFEERAESPGLARAA
jgi:hypothetical protein